MIVALTGATGFVGGHVLRRLREGGHAVRALTRRPRAATEGVVWIDGALDNETALARLCEGADATIHVAGVVNAPNARGFDAGNRLGTVAMLHAAEGGSARRFVHISSLVAREPGLSDYGASKRAAEDAVIVSGLDWRVVRPPAIYGPGDTDMLALFQMAKRGLVLLPPPGKLSVIHAGDLARLIVALAEAPEGGLFEADDGREGAWTHAEFARAIGDAVGRKARGLHMSPALLRLGARIDRIARGDKAKLTPDRVGYFCHPDWTIDPALRPPVELWSPAIATPDGLAQTAAWYRGQDLL
ncbi:MAG: NAD(P)H-binding protein [Sphingomonadaceae bacterium]|nr:NAD(P)H-binding protein [Sphingomonadaceae bacterium]